MNPDWSAAGPEAMRQALADYVMGVHRAYVSQATLLAPGESAAMPLLAGSPLTVVVAAARDLHLIATTYRLPAPTGHEVELNDGHGGLSWTVRFYDPSLLPMLGGLEDGQAVRSVIGIGDVIYHLRVGVGGGLGEHHAQHAGVALAHEHAVDVRDAAQLRRLYVARAPIVEEFVIAQRLGLTRAAQLLAAELAGTPVDSGSLAKSLIAHAQEGASR